MTFVDNNGIVRFEDTDKVSPLHPVFNALAQSVSDRFNADVQFHRVSNQTQRNALVGTPLPTRANPLFVWRNDAAAGRQLEYTVDGVNWHYYESSEAPNLLPRAIRSGTVSISTNSSSGGTAAVTFPTGSFLKAPMVMATKQSGGAAKYVPYVNNVTATGMTVGIYAGDGTAANQTAFVGWVAIEGF